MMFSEMRNICLTVTYLNYIANEVITLYCIYDYQNIEFSLKMKHCVYTHLIRGYNPDKCRKLFPFLTKNPSYATNVHHQISNK